MRECHGLLPNMDRSQCCSRNSRGRIQGAGSPSRVQLNSWVPLNSFYFKVWTKKSPESFFLKYSHINPIVGNKHREGLTALILTHNESDKIAKALNSVKSIADQIVIVDDNSEKSFVDLCKRISPKTEIYKRKLDDFASQKNFGISKASHEWVLNLDADEEVSPKLAAEIRELCAAGSVYDAFSIKFTTVLFGKYLKNHESHIRLFRNGGAKFEHSVHESLKIRGKMGKLKGDIIHHHWNGFDEWFSKLNYYARQAALRDIRNGKNFSKTGILLRMLFVPLVNFVDGFFIKKRYKLGFDGFVHSIVGGANSMRRFAIYYEIKYKRPALFQREFGRDKYE